MAGQSLPIALTVEYPTGAENAALTAALTTVMGAAPTSNTDVGPGVRTTVYAAQDFSSDFGSDAIRSLFANVLGRIGGMQASVTVTLTIAL